MSNVVITAIIKDKISNIEALYRGGKESLKWENIKGKVKIKGDEYITQDGSTRSGLL